jgi:hypothetical protein
MKHLVLVSAILLTTLHAQALTISEVMSNPTGDDNGREWIEIYNEGSADIDISSMTVSIKGAVAVVTTPLQGGTTLPPNGYAIIGSVVSGQTKFLQDYPTYSGVLFKSSVSLVNTGATSIDIKLGGVTVASLPSYTAAKEGSTLSYVGGSYVAGTPTPGVDNQATDSNSSGSSNTTSTASTTTETQVTVAQLTPPSSDIVVYLPSEKIAVAGAPTEFSVFSQTRLGKAIPDLNYTWSFGDGGQGTGSTTMHRYDYSGRYITQVEALNANTTGSGRVVVRVVAPDLTISQVGTGKYGAYVDIKNTNSYDLDLSQWKLVLDNAPFSFPQNTWLLAGQTTRFSGSAMGFASTTLSSSSTVKILFPSLEEVTRYEQPTINAFAITVPSSTIPAVSRISILVKPKMVLGASTTTVQANTTTPTKVVSLKTKDTRLISWIKALLHR